MTLPQPLAAHLESWLGVWPPPTPGVTVVGSPRRSEPGWNGAIRRVAGVSTPEGAVISVPPSDVNTVRSLGDDLAPIRVGLAAALGLEDWRFVTGVFRWTQTPTSVDHAGVWLPRDDPRVPSWLHPFNGDVLVGLVDNEVAAGVGRKQHDRWGHELAVVTEEPYRGRGWATRLVAQAAHQVLADGAIPTYLHGEGNLASARTADAAGFPDRGWKILGLFPWAPA